MKSLTLKSKMEELNITGSHSRPRASNDNAYSESLFRTMKYRPEWPTEGFKDLEAVRKWVDVFVSWYNDEHCYSRIRLVTPSQGHQGADKGILTHREKVYEEAKKRNPGRWSGGNRNWHYKKEVALNSSRTEEAQKKAA